MENREQTHVCNLELIAYSLAFILAIGLRFIKLGASPMGDLEAANALQALKIASSSVVTVGGQPGYVVLTSMLFFVFGSSEFWARFWPAIFGVGLVFIPLLYRRWLGIKPAFFLALFFAIEPGFIALSRTSTGTMIGLVSTLAAVGFLINRKPFYAGFFTAIALLGGVSFWPGVLGVVISVGVYLWIRKFWNKDNLEPGFSIFFSINWKLFLFSTLGTALLLGTDFFLKPQVISGLGTSIADYFHSWSIIGNGVSAKVMLVGLLGEQLLAILLACWGAISGWQKHCNIIIFFVIWLLISTTFTLLNPSRQVVDWSWTLLPIWVLAAFGFGDLLQLFTNEEWILKIFQTIATIALLVFSFLNFLSMAVGVNNLSPISDNFLLDILLPLVLLVVVTLLIGWGWSSNASRQGFLMGVGLILVVITFGSAWKAAGLGPRPEAELWRSDALPVGRDLLLKQIDNLSLWNTGQINGTDIDLLNQNQPSLLWALRDFRGVKQVDILADSDSPSVILGSTSYALTLAQTYQGQQVTWASAINYDQMTAKDWFNWFTFRRVPTTSINFILWARANLFKSS